MRHLKTYKSFNEDTGGAATANASTTAGMGGVSNAQPGGLPGTFGTDGSGDLSFYLKRRRRKKGNPSQVSDLRDLAPVKINKLTEAYNDVQEYRNEIQDELKKYDIRPVELNRILNFYEDEIQSDFESGQYPKFFVDKIVKELELGNDGGFISQKMSPPRNQTIKYL